MPVSFRTNTKNWMDFCFFLDAFFREVYSKYSLRFIWQQQPQIQQQKQPFNNREKPTTSYAKFRYSENGFSSLGSWINNNNTI